MPVLCKCVCRAGNIEQLPSVRLAADQAARRLGGRRSQVKGQAFGEPFVRREEPLPVRLRCHDFCAAGSLEWGAVEWGAGVGVGGEQGEGIWDQVGQSVQPV